MRTCSRCKQHQPDGEFYKADRYTNRIRTICRTCVTKRAKERRLAGLTQATERARYQASERYRRRQRENTAKWRRRYPEKIKAQNALQAEIRRGRMSRQPCEVCGAKAHAHHDDYTKPLDVRWLCPLHHARHHREVTGVSP